MNFFSLLCFSILFISYSHAQFKVDLSEVDLIALSEDHDDIYFYIEKEKGYYQELWIDFYENEDEWLTFEKEYDSDLISAKDIIEDNCKLIELKDFKKTTISRLTNINWNFKTHEETYNLKFFKSGIATVQEIYFDEHISNSFSKDVLRKDKRKKKWRNKWDEWYSIITLNFRNNINIFLLEYENDIEYAFLPFKDYNYVINYSDESSKAKNSNAIYNIDYPDTFKRFERYYESFFNIKKTENNTYKLVNRFNQNILKKEFDTIYNNNYHIVGKTKNDYTFYNYSLDTLVIPIKNIKYTYLYNRGLEILTKNGPVYFDYNSKQVTKFPLTSYSVCGTTNATTHTIKKNKKGNYHITKSYDGLARSTQRKKDFIIKKIRQKDKLSFIDNDTITSWDANDEFTGTHYLSPNYLKIIRNGKSGIIKCNYPFDVKNESTILDTIYPDFFPEKIISYKPKKINPEIVFQINNDSIVYNRYHRLIYFYRDSKVGLYPRHKNVVFDSITRKTNSFYRIVKNGKKGWLDIHTNNEYYFE